MEKENIKDRFKIFLKYLGIGQGKFESITEIGNGTINNIKDGISSPKLAKIVETYPNLNIDWLLTGKGNMLKQVDQPSGIDIDVTGHQNRFANISSGSIHQTGINQNEDMICIPRSTYEMMINTIESLQKIIEKLTNK